LRVVHSTLRGVARALDIPVKDLIEEPVPLGEAPVGEAEGPDEQAHRLQLLRELREHVTYMTEHFRAELARLKHEGTRQDWDLLVRDAAFGSIGAHYMLTDESGAPEGLSSETERRAWRHAHQALAELDALCNEIDATAAAVRGAADRPLSGGTVTAISEFQLRRERAS
jgi:hypothetical protein